MGAGLQPGTRLGDAYELIEPVGRGGMATVWRGLRHGAAGFRREVAIKRLHEAFAHQPEFDEMFVEEARVVSGLHHPGIVQIYDFAKDADERAFIVMEWVEGLDLGRFVQAHASRGVATPWREIVYVLLQAATALEAAHAHRDEAGASSPIFHRDFTPSNVLLGVHGHAKLADFGLARATDRMTMTTPGMLKGKLAYCAPELVAGARASVATDLYSCGVVLWECLAGRRLFHAKNEIELFVKVGQAQVPRLSDARADLPAALVDLVAETVAAKARERPNSAGDLVLRLEAILRDDGTPVTPRHVAEAVRAARARRASHSP